MLKKLKRTIWFDYLIVRVLNQGSASYIYNYQLYNFKTKALVFITRSTVPSNFDLIRWYKEL